CRKGNRYITRNKKIIQIRGHYLCATDFLLCQECATYVLFPLYKIQKRSVFHMKTASLHHNNLASVLKVSSSFSSNALSMSLLIFIFSRSLITFSLYSLIFLFSSSICSCSKYGSAIDRT